VVQVLHIIASCTDRKRRTPAEPVRLRDVDGHTVAARAAAWWKRLDATPKAAKVRADELYAGDHWAVARDLNATARVRGWEPTLWVASGGYGLVRHDAMLHPYSATLTSGQADSVLLAPREEHDRDSSLVEWWYALADRIGPQKTAARTIEKLAMDSRDSTLLVIASPDYVTALSDDLSSARDALDDPDRLVIVTSALKGRASRLNENRVASEARLADQVGGAMTGLHARVARMLIGKLAPGDFTADRARKVVARAAARAVVRPRPDRTAVSDAQVLTFVRKQIRRDATVTHSRLLRELRAAGLACEQHRFRDLFRSVSEGRHGPA